MEHPTINLGGYTKPRTKAQHDREAVVAQAIEIAKRSQVVLLVKRDHLGRWQAWEKRGNPRGAGHPADYELLPTGRRAKKRRVKMPGGCVYVADTAAARGPCQVEKAL